MKKLIIISVIFTAMLITLPMGFKSLFGAEEILKPQDSFALLSAETGAVTELSAADYIIGCLYAQIPAEYEEEALKAQAAAAYTYALRIKRTNGLNPAGKLPNADFSDDGRVYQAYFTEKKAKDFYKADYDKYYDKIRRAAEYGIHHIIAYDNEPIYAVYHSVSAGRTNIAKDIWGRNFPYLKSVDSSWDRESQNFVCQNQTTKESMRAMLLAADRNIEMPVDYTLWFSDLTNNTCGYAENVRVGNKTYSGGDIWRILGLRSAAFTVKYTGSVFEIETLGYGHGAGMSQYGADYMARHGHTAEEILTHYYSGVKIVSR